jgi:hypothetical protein
MDETQLVEQTVIDYFLPIARLILNQLLDMLVKVLKVKGKNTGLPNPR